MSKEMQIEEMACAICGNSTICNGVGVQKCILHPQMRRYAYNAYKDGYRKQIKAEWKSGNKNGQYGYYCTNCDACFTGENAEWIAKEHDYCPKCGAKMKGGE